MLSTLKNAWRIPDMRKKITFTLLMLLIFRLGSAIPVPFMNKEVIKQVFERSSGGVLQFLDLMGGGTFSNFSIFALNIYPYVTSSIIIQLLTIAIPRLEEIAKEGEEGRKKLAQWTRYGTVILAVVQAIGITIGFFKKALISTSFISVAVVIISLTAGTAFLMWLGEQITDKGIGNGISLIIFIGIISRIPYEIAKTINLYKAGSVNIIGLILFVIFALITIAIVVAIQEGERRIPVQYAKRVVGRKMYGGQSTHIPVKVSMAGVIPVIFSTSLLAFPQVLSLFFSGKAKSEVEKITGIISKWYSRNMDLLYFEHSIDYILYLFLYSNSI